MNFLRVSVSLLLCWILPAHPMAMNVKEDGGASVYNENPRIPANLSLVSPALVGKFPLAQRSEIHVMGGGVRGFGLLAQYKETSPKQVVVARKTATSEIEPYTPIALVSVFDPDGNIAVIKDVTDQPSGTETWVLDIPKGKAGIWRVSFSGGRKGDLVEIRLPGTLIWGVRGEMAIGAAPSLPQPAYLWVPPVSTQVLVGIDGGCANGFALENVSGGKVLASPTDDKTGRVARMTLDPAPAGEVVRMVWPEDFTGSFVVDGAPGLWCPTEEAAKALQGGAVQAAGVWVAGPLQARARKWMAATAPTLDKNPTFEFPQTIPENVKDLSLEVLAFQKYGPLNHLTGMVEDQNANLDPSSPYFGTDYAPTPSETPTPGWTNFQPGRLAGPFQAGSIAAAAAFQSPLNPSYGNPEIIKRAALAAFHHISWLEGDDLLRENSLFKSTYPLTHAFFVYDNLAQGYLQLKEMLPSDAAAIWKQGVMAVGDKLADFQAYQSNQWSHMISGHLAVYMATGEKRFLHFFERLLTSYLDNTFGPQSKFGQHPAGYFLEQNGPDGNYDKLNSFSVALCYYEYRDLPEANPELVEKLWKSIDKNLRFVSFFWLPQPDGEITSPNALNCRTSAGLGSPGYPGHILPKSDFALAAARHALTPAPTQNLGPASTFSFLANTDEWIRKTVEDGLRKGAKGYPGGGGAWLPALHKSFSQPKTVEVGLIPVEEDGKTWQLPGLLAFNEGGIYGVVFYDVIGADQMVPGITGGSPSALWNKATGTFVQSMHPGAPPESSKLTDPKSLTFACIYGQDSRGGFFYSGKQRAEMKELEGAFVISSKLDSPFARLEWSYRPSSEGLELGVRLDSKQDFKESFVNLPLSTRLEGVRVELVSPNELHFVTAGGGVSLTWPKAYPGQLADSVLKDICRLIIPLPTDASLLLITVRRLPAGVATLNP